MERETGRGELALSVGKLRGFVVNSGPHFVRYLGRNFVHAVIGARMIGTLLKNILFAVALSDEIAVHANISTADYLCHKFLQTEFGARC